MNVIIIPEITAWGCSGLRADDFRNLVNALIASDRMARSGRDLVFPNLKTAALVLSGRPRRRKGKR